VKGGVMICPFCGGKFNEEKSLNIHYGKVHATTTGRKNDIRLALDKKALQNFRLARRWKKLQEEQG
jgi:uncharacterized C2H2 Zn-finger protein